MDPRQAASSGSRGGQALPQAFEREDLGKQGDGGWPRHHHGLTHGGRFTFESSCKCNKASFWTLIHGPVVFLRVLGEAQIIGRALRPGPQAQVTLQALGQGRPSLAARLKDIFHSCPPGPVATARFQRRARVRYGGAERERERELRERETESAMMVLGLRFIVQCTQERRKGQWDTALTQRPKDADLRARPAGTDRFGRSGRAGAGGAGRGGIRRRQGSGKRGQ